VLPVFIPVAVVTLEPTKRRKWMMAPFALIGTVIAGVLLAAMVRGLSASSSLRTTSPTASGCRTGS
jgi:hypothetical protein